MEKIYYYTLFLWLLGVILIILARFKNPIAGYRTPRSYKSKRHWNYANRLSGVLCIIFGFLWALIHFITLNYTDLSPYGDSAALLFVSGFVLILIIVETRLKRLN